MEHSFALCALLSIILLTTTNARTGPTVDGDIISELTIKIDARSNPEEYWRAITGNQPIPKALQSLFRSDPSLPVSSEEIADCHTLSEKTNKKDKSFAKDFDEPRPTISTHHENEKKETSLAKDFEPRPSLLAHHENGEPKKGGQYFKDFDPSPDVTIYQN